MVLISSISLDICSGGKARSMGRVATWATRSQIPSGDSGRRRPAPARRFPSLQGIERIVINGMLSLASTIVCLGDLTHFAHNATPCSLFTLVNILHIFTGFFKKLGLAFFGQKWLNRRP